MTLEDNKKWWIKGLPMGHESRKKLLSVYFKDKLDKNMTILDLGCGNGEFFSFIKDCIDKRNYVGIDISPEILMEFFKTYNILNLLLVESLKIPYLDSTFDVSICFSVLTHYNLECSIIILSELKRVTKKTIYVSVILGEKEEENRMHYLHTETNILKMFKDLGLRIVSRQVVSDEEQTLFELVKE